MNFRLFPVLYLGNSIVIRLMKESYVEYQIHKVLSWGQYEISSAKRRLGSAKETPVPIAPHRTPGQTDTLLALNGRSGMLTHPQMEVSKSLLM